MLITSGPIVPEMASSKLVFPVARFFSSYFVLIRCIRRVCLVCLTPQRCTAVQGNQAYTSRRREPPRRVHLIADGLRAFKGRACCAPRADREIRPLPVPPVLPVSRTSCETCRRDRRCPQFSACPCRTDGSWNKLRPANPVRWSNGSRTCSRRYK